ncbi:hypothetical protein ACFQYP_24330 [Nonomuraea antimicrobica]
MGALRRDRAARPGRAPRPAARRPRPALAGCAAGQRLAPAAVHPRYSWYALLVVALAAMDGRWEWLGVALAGAVAYIAGPSAPAGPGTPSTPPPRWPC